MSVILGQKMQLTSKDTDVLWDELAAGLQGNDPDDFIEDMQKSGKLKEILPEVDALFGVPQTAEYHPEIDTGRHTLMTLRKARDLNGGLAVRFAALVHDLGKAVTDPDHWPKHHNHEELGVPLVEGVSDRLGVPQDVKELAVNVARFHLHAHRAMEMRPNKLVNLFENTGALDNPESFEEFIVAVQADAQGRLGMEDKPYPQADFLRATLKAANDVDVNDLLQDGELDQITYDKIRQRRIEAVRSTKATLELDTLS